MMKKHIMLILISLSFLLLLADITSTTAGGNWNDPNTWIGLEIPGVDDNVIIDGTVSVNTTASCNNLTNSSTGSLQNSHSGSYQLKVYGDINNAGTIRSHPSGGYFMLQSRGDIINSSVFSPRSLDFASATDQHISDTGTFSPTYITDADPASAVILLTDLSLNTTNIDLSNALLVLNNSSVTSDLSMSAGSLKNVIIQGGNGATLTTSNACTLQDVSGDEIVLAGDTMVISGVVFDSVINNGEIFNHYNGYYTLTINTGLENHGTIRNHNSSGYLYLNLLGDLYDYGTISANTLSFSNTVQRVLWQDPAADPISSSTVKSLSTAGFQVLSDLRFSGSTIDLNGNSLQLYDGAGSYGVSLSGGRLFNGTLDTDGYSTLNLSSSAYLSDLIAGDIIFEGTAIFAANCSFNSIINNATLQNHNNSSYTLTINTSLENHGIIRNHASGGYFYLTLLGDLYDYGTISMNTLNFTNTAQRVLWQDPAADPISSSTVKSLSTAGFQVLSDLRFSGSAIDFGGNTLMLYDLDNSYGLSLSGGKLYNATFETDGFSHLDMSDGAYIYNLNGGDIILHGVVSAANDCSFDSIINYATLQNHSNNSYNMTITTRLENRGIIRNHASGGYFYLTLLGDLYDYGTIGNRKMILSNTEPRVLWQDPQAEAISSPIVQSLSTGDFQLLSDLRFSASDIDLNGNTLMLHNGRSSYGISLSGGRLSNATLDTAGFSTLTMSGGAYLADLDAEDIIFQGVVGIGANCIFDDVVNYAELRNHSNNSYSLIISGNLVNYGTIKNNPAGGYLYLNSRKDLSNYGTIQNYRVSIDGSLDQYILNPGMINVTNFQLVSEVGSAQWYYNGSLSGVNYSITKIIDPNVTGVWQPRGTSDGRYITIGGGATALPAPENLSIYLNLGEMKLRWDEVDDAIYYDVYSSTTPDGSFALLGRVFDNDLGNGQVLITITEIDTPRFYKVTAGN